MKGENGRVKKKKSDFVITSSVRSDGISGHPTWALWGHREICCGNRRAGTGAGRRENSFYSLIKASVACRSKAVWKKMSDTANEDRCS